MRNKNILGSAVVAIAATAVLTSCSGTNEAAERVTLTYAIWDANQEPAMAQIASEFEASHPGTKIEIQLIPGTEFFTKMQTALAGGAGPDVFWMNGPNIQLYASNGVIAPLDEEKIDAADYIEGLVELYTFDGQLYGAPKDFDTVGVWYNKELFDAAGLDYPTPGWTWQDVSEIAAALTDPEKGQWGIGAGPGGQKNYYNTIFQAGGEVISSDGRRSGFGSAETLAGVTFWTDLLSAGSSPTLEQMSDTRPEELFLSGKIAMLQNPSFAALQYAENADIADKVDVAPLPAGPAGNQSVIHGLANVANAKSPHVDLAKEFAVFASGSRASEIQAESGTVIPAFKGTQQAWVDALPQYDLQTFIDAAASAKPYPISRNTAAWVAIQDEIMAKIWAGSVEPEEGLQELAERMQSVLDAESE